ncbi:MAG: efflux RND transporter periplasmic adaptor subunit [Patescibacteria group bacterium]|nr:efflux RND transporter periplasmic adaptor subunit [Patescibacteria group bacterium]
MEKKKIIGIIVIVSLLIIFAYRTIFKKAEDGFVFAEVKIGNVIQEISETGQVKKGEQIELNFKTSGVLEKIYVEIGEEVKEKDILAKLEDAQLNIQLAEAQASLELYQAQLDKLLAGATSEEIQASQTDVDNAQISLNNAKQTLEDIETQGQEDLKSAYEDALNVLDDSYIKIFNSFNAADSIQRTYFTSNDQQSISVRENKDKIKSVLDGVESYLDTAKTTQENNDIDITIADMKSALNDTSDALKIIRENCEALNYRNTISSADKTLLDTHRGYINTALTNTVNSQQTISSIKLDNSVNTNTYSAKVDTAQGSLKTAQDDLAKLVAPARDEDVSLYQAQVKQAQAQLWLLQKQIADTTLKSPINGQIAKIEKRVGELVQSALADAIITILPDDPFKIEVDIYEEDVTKMDIGNPVNITLVAFSEQVLTGKVISIDPAEKIIDGVVYYEVSVSLDNPLEGVKPGMTADLVIRTAFKENVLTVPKRAVKKKNGKTIVRVLENTIITEREIEIGLKGTNDVTEIVSGLEQGEQVILP